MSASPAATTTTTVSDTRFNNLSYAAISLIASYFATTPEQAVQNFGLVNKRFHDALTNHAREVWIRLIRSSFSKSLRSVDTVGSPASSSLSTYNAFLKMITRFKLRKDVVESKKNAGKINKKVDNGRTRDNLSTDPLFEIENCGSQQQTGDEQIDFSFTCPVLAQNLTRLSNETTEDGLPILFCDICRKKVYTIDGSKPEQLNEAVKLGRCVNLSEDSASMLRELGALGSMTKINIGFLVANEEQANTVSSLFHRIHMSRQFGVNERDEPMYRFKNAIEFESRATRPPFWNMQILDADHFDKNDEAKAAPALGGWTFLVELPGVDLKEGKTGSQLLALQKSGRVHKYEKPPADFDPAKPFQIVDGQAVIHRNPLDFESDAFAGTSFDLFWQFLEGHIIEKFKMPQGIRGRVARIQKVRLSGPTIKLDPEGKNGGINYESDDDVSSDDE